MFMWTVGLSPLTERCLSPSKQLALPSVVTISEEGISSNIYRVSRIETNIRKLFLDNIGHFYIIHIILSLLLKHIEISRCIMSWKDKSTSLFLNHLTLSVIFVFKINYLSTCLLYIYIYICCFFFSE